MDKIRRLEERQKRMEDALGLNLQSRAASPVGNPQEGQGSGGDDGDGEGARYRLTVDDGGNVSDNL
jgi:hypothetical protein